MFAVWSSSFTGYEQIAPNQDAVIIMFSYTNFTENQNAISRG